MRNNFLKLNLFAVILCSVVVILGAYTRLTDAGLGCPDWPGCYGQIGSPTTSEQIKKAKKTFPGQKIDTEKGWNEMIHRYAVGVLGLLVLSLFVIALRSRHMMKWEFKMTIFLVALIVFQGYLGYATVAYKLDPRVVTAHLIFGFTTLTSLWILYYRASEVIHSGNGSKSLRVFIFASIVVLASQIALGGWTGSNYAAITCTEFPSCNQGKYFADADFKDAFAVTHSFRKDIDYEFGKLKPEARIAIHMTHRVGALITFTMLFLLAVWLILRHPASRGTAMLLLIALGVQVALGISVVLKAKPLLIAVAHNGVGALLLIILVTLFMKNRESTRLG